MAQASELVPFSPRFEQTIRAFGTLAAVAIGALVARPGVSQLWLIPPIIAAVSAGIYLFHYSPRSDHLEVKGELSLLLHELNLPPQSNARATYHEVRRNWKYLWTRRCFHQIVNYLPEDKRGRGDRYPVDQGIGGRAYEDKEDFIENFQTPEQYRQAMTSQYNFTADSLKKRAPDRKSFMCFCVINQRNAKVRGLLWFDATAFETFPLVSQVVDRMELVDSVVQRLRSRFG